MYDTNTSRGGMKLTLTFAYETYYIILCHIFSIFILLFVNYAIWLKAKKIPLLYSYLAVQGIILIWMVSKILKTVAPNGDLKFLFVICQYTGVCFLGEVFFIFAYMYAAKKMLAVKYIVLLTIFSAFFLLVIITNPYHLLFYKHFDFWGDSFGPAFYFHQGYNYALILAGLILCSINFSRQFGEKRIQALLFSIAIIVPIAANMLYIFDWFELVFRFEPPFDITPIACNISLMVFVLATFKYRFFDDVKIARRNALALIPDGIILLDDNSRIIDFNDTFKKMYENDELYAENSCGIIKKLPVKQSLALYDKANFVADEIQPADRIYQTEKGCYYRAVCQFIHAEGRACGMSMRFIDNTFRQNILTKVESKNLELDKINKKLQEQACMVRELATARTRNFIAGEVHDILGHSVVLVISLLEVARFSLDKAAFDFSSCINQAEGLLEGCLKRIENSILGQSDMIANQYSLIDKLHMLLNEVKSASVAIELNVSGRIPQLPKQYKDTIFKLCRECITNAIRHGKADKVNIILRFLSDSIEIYVIDNGVGCNNINKGMGIVGMETRLKEVDGFLLYSSVGGQGFCVQAVIPYN